MESNATWGHEHDLRYDAVYTFPCDFSLIGIVSGLIVLAGLIGFRQKRKLDVDLPDNDRSYERNRLPVSL